MKNKNIKINKKYSRKIEIIEQENNALLNFKEQTLNSTSWKITKPLRAVLSFFSK